MRRKKHISTIFYDANNTTVNLVENGHIIPCSMLLFLALFLQAVMKNYTTYSF
jgi:hypothetical protein